MSDHVDLFTTDEEEEQGVGASSKSKGAGCCSGLLQTPFPLRITPKPVQDVTAA